MIPRRSIATHSTWTSPATVIGIDPGLARTGIAVIHHEGSSCSLVSHEVVRTSTAAPLAERLAQISTAISNTCAKERPVHAAIERTFINANPASSLSLGQARGAALAALGLFGLDVSELAPNMIKKRVTGDHIADKKKVAKMVKLLLGIDSNARISSDATDALAIALSLPGQANVRTAVPKGQSLRRNKRALRRR